MVQTNEDKPKNLKIAIIQAFKLDGEKPGDLLAQLKALTDKDLEDFARIFKSERGWEWEVANG